MGLGYAKRRAPPCRRAHAAACQRGCTTAWRGSGGRCRARSAASCLARFRSWGAAIALPLPPGFTSSIARFLSPESAFRCRNLAIDERGPHRTPPLPAFGRPLLTATGSAAGSVLPRAPPAGTRPAGLGPGPAPSLVPLFAYRPPAARPAPRPPSGPAPPPPHRSEEHTSALRHVAISYAVFCVKKNKERRSA